MERITEYLSIMDLNSLMLLAKETDSNSFGDESPVRKLINDYKISPNFHTGLIGLKTLILSEIVRRFYNNLQNG